jgi:uncharacterized membrane protein YhhN
VETRGVEVEPRDRFWVGLAAVSFLAFGVLESRIEVALAAILKMAPLGFLAKTLLRVRGKLGSFLPAAALLLHALGDGSLEIEKRLPGLIAFLLGHLLWIQFLFPRRLPWELVFGVAKLRLGMLCLMAAFFLPFLLERASAEWRLPVVVYAAALLSFAGLAQVAPFRGIGFGALLFVASDLLLGMTWFGGRAFGFEAAVWPLYGGAQLLIAVGLLQGRSAGVPRAGTGGMSEKERNSQDEEEASEATPETAEMRSAIPSDPVEEGEGSNADACQSLARNEPGSGKDPRIAL